MGTILSVLGLIAQLRSSGFFSGSSSVPTSSPYIVPGKFEVGSRDGVRRNQF